MGEFIGRHLTVTESRGVSGLPVEGVIVDETLNMLYLSVPGRSARLGLQKRGLRGRIRFENIEIDLIGDALRVRPEDRIKRWATRRMAR